MAANNLNKAKVNIPKLIRDQPLVGATISKMNRDDKAGKISLQSLTNRVDAVSNNINDKIKNNESILELFPDIELAIQILVSSVISPNDLITTNSIYYGPELLLPPEISSSITETVRKYINVNYNLDDGLYELLKETLFTKGATAIAIIPEAAVDDIINPDYNGQIAIESLERQFSSLGLLGTNSNVRYSVESKVENASTILNMKALRPGEQSEHSIMISEEMLDISITDKLSVLNLPNLINKRLRSNVGRKIKGYLAKEDYVDDIEDNYSTLNHIFKPNSRLGYKPIKSVNTIDSASRRSIGKPLVIKLPIESVIPVHAINDVTKHLGYFILLDEKGTPVDLDSELDSEISQDQTACARSNMIQRAKAALQGMTRGDVKLENMEQLYAELVERMIKEKLKTGEYSDIVDIKENADIYRVMFYRSLKAQKTKLLFIPSELLMYYAFEYRSNGTGKSLLEKNAMLFSLRSILLFAKLMATVKNSVTTTEVTAEIDEQIADPEKVREMIISEVLKTREQQLPIGVSKLKDLVEWVHHSGFKFNIKHPGLPNLDLSFQDTNTSKVVPEETLDEDLRERQYMSFGLTPEIIQSGYSDTFATTVVAKNLLFAKRTSMLQDKLNVMRTEHVRKLIRSDAALQDIIKEIIEVNKADIWKFIKNKGKSKTDESVDFDKIKKDEIADFVLDAYANEIVVELPRPQLQEANSIKESFETYKDTLEQYLDIILSSQAYPTEIAGEFSGQMDRIKAILKTVFTRKWMTDNGYFTEISEFLTLGKDDKPIFDAFGDFSSYLETLYSEFAKFIKDHNKNISKMDKELEKLGADDVEGGSMEDSSSSDTSDSDSSGDEGDTGGDDFGDMGDDFVDEGGEETTEESTEEEPTEDTTEEQPAE